MCLRRRHVRIAHAEIDDVGPARSRRRLQPVDLGENVGRQALDAVEFLDHGTTAASAPSSAPPSRAHRSLPRHMPQRRASTEAVFARFAGGVLRRWRHSRRRACACHRLWLRRHRAGIRIDADSVFNIASTSKQFTAFALQLLAGDGRLALDDSVRRYVPELPGYADAVSLRQLMHHTGRPAELHRVAAPLRPHFRGTHDAR